MIFFDECLNPLLADLFKANVRPSQPIITSRDIGFGLSDFRIIRKLNQAVEDENLLVITQDVKFYRDCEFSSKKDWFGIVEIVEMSDCYRTQLFDTIQELLREYSFFDLIGVRMRVHYWKYFEKAWK